MEIRFSQQEIALISHYFNGIDAEETQKQLPELRQKFSEWNTVFLLLRKLLAYGIYANVPTNSVIGYEALQKISQKPDHMRATVHTYLGEFKQVLAVYMAHHVNTVS